MSLQMKMSVCVMQTCNQSVYKLQHLMLGESGILYFNYNI